MSVSVLPSGYAIFAKQSPSLQFANSETRAQAFVGDTYFTNKICYGCKKWFPLIHLINIDNKISVSDFGFIEGVITRKGIPAAAKQVICLDSKFNLVAETSSLSDGYYRFDSLPRNEFFAIHAYDNDIYQYAPVGADRRMPEAYL